MLLFTTCLTAQVDSTTAATQIQERLDVYFQANEEKDFDVILDMIYPKLYDLAPRPQVKSQFEAMDAGGMTFSIYDMAANAFSAPFVHEEEQFVLVDYSHGMDMVLTDTSMQASAATMLPIFEGQYGKENVSYDADNFRFTMAISKKMLAIAPLASQKWMFIDFDPKNPVVLDMLFDEAVKEHFTR